MSNPIDTKIPEKVTVAAPATIANLGTGFDILGLAIEEPYDVVTAERVRGLHGVIIESITGDNGRLPLDASKNTAGVAAAAALKQIDALVIHDHGVKLTLQKGLPLESGMGSSAASAVAGAVAVNELFGNPLSREELLPACVEGEAVVSGRHADNVAPALLGGLVLITGITPDAIYRLPVPENLVLVLVTPAISVPTAQARAVLPKSIALGDYVKQSASVGLLIHAIHTGDLATMGQAMERDFIIEPAREHLMPGLREVRQAAQAAGAFGTIISGAGPTLCSICDSRKTGQRVAKAMQGVYERLNISCTTLVTGPARTGAVATAAE